MMTTTEIDDDDDDTHSSMDDWSMLLLKEFLVEVLSKSSWFSCFHVWEIERIHSILLFHLNL